MPYEYDIFLSYPHDLQMESWVHQHLIPFMELIRRTNADNKPVKIFVDRTGITAVKVGRSAFALRLRGRDVWYRFGSRCIFTLRGAVENALLCSTVKRNSATARSQSPLA